MQALFSHRANVSPKRPTQDRRNSGVSAALWEWLDPMHSWFSHGASLFPKRPRQNKGLGCMCRCAGVAESCAYPVLPRGVPIP